MFDLKLIVHQTYNQLTTGISKKIENCENGCNLFQKVKLSYILDSLHVK